ncbi:EpsG family protein [Fusobacterium nucleatum]|nr:EpsG family protein [Fusobacterium nucleatum]
MGTDWVNYQYFYDCKVPYIGLRNLYDNSFMFSSEKAFMLLNVLFYNLGFSYELFVGIIISFSIFFILKFIEERTDNFYFSFFLSIVIFLLGYSLEPVLRQLIALTLIVIGFKYIEKRCFFKYLLIIILAVQFHLSAFIAFPLYFLEKIKLDKKRYLFIFIGVYISILLISNIFLELTSVFPKLLKYEHYFLSSRYGLSRNRSILGEIYHIILIIVYGYIVFYGYNFSKKKKNYLKNMALFYIIIDYFNNIFPILYRVSHYFVIGFVISLGSIKFIRLPNKKIIKLGRRFMSWILLIFLYIPFLSDAWKEIYGTKLNIYRYGNYKNYFIEMANGRLKSNFYEKSEEYRKNTEDFLNEEDRERDEKRNKDIKMVN